MPPYIKVIPIYKAANQISFIPTMRMAEIIRFTLLLGYALFCIIENSSGEPLEDISEDYVPIMVRRNDFFLKAAKSVPRIGRRNDFYFSKTLKPIPRIVRRNDFFLKAAKSVPRIGRRDELATVERESTAAWPWFRDHDFIPRVMKKDIDLFEESMPLEDHSKEQEEPRFQPLV